MTTKERTTVSLERGDLNLLGEIAEENGWPVGKAAGLAIKTLQKIMAAHAEYAAQHPDDVASLYMQLARQAPAGFVEVPKDGVLVGHAGDVPAIQIGDWLISDLDGVLMAEEMTGDRRLGKVIDGEVKPLRLPVRQAGLN